MWVGEDYPARLERRQFLGKKLFNIFARVGAHTALARYIAPGNLDADPALVTEWWLGLLDAVPHTRDVVRELALAARTVEQTAAHSVYETSRAVAASRAAAADDADDEEIGLGAANARANEGVGSPTRRTGGSSLVR